MGQSGFAPEGAVVGGEFLALYRRSIGEVYSYLASRVGDRSTAEDLTQEVYMAGARRFAAGEEVEVAWLIAVGRNKLVDYWRARAREDRKLERVQALPLPLDEDPTAGIGTGEAAAALATLNPTYRAALVLRHVDGLPVPEVAECLGRTIEATEQVLSRARAAFRSVYEEPVS